MATATRIDMLRDYYKDDTIERIENSSAHARVNGRRAYITDPTAGLSIRHELVADLAATGMKPIDIARVLKKNPESLGGSGHYNMLLRDPQIRARVASKVGNVLDEAKQTLRNSVTKAAENISNAVEKGDIKVSQYVLGTQGLTDKPAQTTATQNNITMDFGSWLTSVTDNKSDIVEVISDSSALPAPIDGELLSDN